MALFVTGETAPFLAEFFDVFIGVCGSSVSLGTLVSIIVGSGPIGPCVHSIWVWEWHFDTQYLGSLLGCEPSRVWLLLLECGLARSVVKYPFDILDCHVVMMVLSRGVGPSLEVVGSDYLENMVHHFER